MDFTHIKDYFANDLEFTYGRDLINTITNYGTDTALRKRRDGSRYQANYERGLLQYALVTKLKPQSYFEIGTGRGFSSLCVLKAMKDAGINGSVTTVDVKLEQVIRPSFKKHGFDFDRDVRFIQSASSELPRIISNNEKYDIIYIDGAHDYESVKKDWEFAKEHVNKMVIFDDFIKDDTKFGIERLMQEIDMPKTFLRMDRRIWRDDRGLTDDQINYGQVVIKFS